MSVRAAPVNWLAQRLVVELPVGRFPKLLGQHDDEALGVDGEPVIVALVTDISTLPVTFPKRIWTGQHLIPVVVRAARVLSTRSEE